MPASPPTPTPLSRESGWLQIQKTIGHVSRACRSHTGQTLCNSQCVAVTLSLVELACLLRGNHVAVADPSQQSYNKTLNGELEKEMWGYISGVYFQKCSDFSIKFFRITYYYKNLPIFS